MRAVVRLRALVRRVAERWAQSSTEQCRSVERPTPAGVVQKRLLFVAVVQANRAVVLLFLLEHFGTD